MAKRFDNCPHCGKDDCTFDIAYENVRHYGSKLVHTACNHCGEPIMYRLYRTVVLDNPVEKSYKSKDDLDW